MSAPGLIVGNLDAEADFVAAAGWPRPGLSKAAAAVASAAATLLRVFARPGDTLVLPGHFDTRRMAPVPGLPCPPVIAADDLRAPQSGGEVGARPSVLAWAETIHMARLRAGAASRAYDRETPAGLARVAPPPCPSADAAWQWPVPSAEASRRANDRQLAWQVARDLGCGLPGDHLVRSLDDWRAAVAAIAGPWVAKARFAAAGRWRCWGEAQPDPATESAVERLLARQGVLRVEPWCQRVRDVGVVALATDTGTRRIGGHELLVDARGRFEGIRVRVSDPREGASVAFMTGLSTDHGARLAAVTDDVGAALRRIGYRGPFGIDAWLWRSEHDIHHGVRLHPLGEINARMTFGLIAHALVARLRDSFAMRDGDRLTLRFGRVPMGHAWPSAAHVLVTPGDRGLAIWLEVDRERSTGQS